MSNILVIGAGVVGITTAYYLRQQNHDVTVVDAASSAATGTSFANGSQLSYSKTHPLSDIETLKRLPKLLFDKNTPIHIHPGLDLSFLRWGMQFVYECMPSRSKKNAAEVLDIALRSRTGLHRIVQQHEMNFDYARRGKMYVFTNEADFKSVAGEVEEHKKHGIEQDLLNAAEAVKIEPALADMQSKIKGVVYSKIDEAGDAKKFSEELARVCEGLGVKFVYDARISEIKTAKGEITGVVAGGKEFTADKYVVCIGAETPRVLGKIGVYVPVYPMKGYSITVPAGELVPEVNITDEEKRVVYAKIGDRLRIAGVAEFTGYDYSINRKIMDGMVAAAKERFPRAGDYGQITEWAGLRPMTPSTVPIIGQNNKYKNLYLNTGHGMLGWTLACGSAEKLAAIIN